MRCQQPRRYGMNEWLMFLMAGAVGGLLVGMIGVGLAFVVVPLLTFIGPSLGIPDASAVRTGLTTSMAVAAIASVASVIAHHRHGHVEWKLFQVLCPAAVAGVSLGMVVVSRMDEGILKAAFAGFMLFSAAVVAFNIGLTKKGEGSTQVGRSLLMIGSGVIGFLASFIGAGGGVFMVPFLAWTGRALNRSGATSLAIGLPVTVVGALLGGTLGARLEVATVGSFGYVYLPAVLIISVGTVIMAPLGAKLTAVVPATYLRVVFGLCVSAIAVKMLL